MIVYFADRNLNILITASTDLPDGLVIKEDVKTEDVETGICTFSGVIGYDDSNDVRCENALMPGNYVFRKADSSDECEVFTIVDSEKDSKSQDIEFNAEDAGLELLNTIALKWPDDDNLNPEPMSLAGYFEMFLERTGFEIGKNDSSGLKTLSWDQEHTVNNRLLDIAQSFDCEINFSFKIEGFKVTQKLVNVYKHRGGSFGVQWRINKEVDRIVTKATAENLATALLCYGSVPEGATMPITLAGVTITDADGYSVEQIYYADREGRENQGYCLCSEKALLRWGTIDADGTPKHVVKTFNYDTVSQTELCSAGLAELQKIENVEYNFEIDVSDVRDARIGDTVNIVDETGQLYLSARLLKLETSEGDGAKKATLGDYLMQSSGISETVRNLADKFATMVNPTISLERDEINRCVTITATDKYGVKTADVYDGQDGQDGQDGKDGEDGQDGNDAPYILRVEEQYCRATQNYLDDGADFETIRDPSTPWAVDLPEYVNGKFYWTRTATYMSDGTVKYSDPVFDVGDQLAGEAEEVANVASDAATTAQGIANSALSTANSASSAASTAQQTANSALGKANTIENHFWYDSSGAHVAENAGTVATGASQTIASNGTVMMRNGKLVTSWTGSSSSDAALNFYDCTSATARDADLMASYTRSGINLYANNARMMSLTSSGTSFYQSDGSTLMATYSSTGASLYAGGALRASISTNACTIYGGSTNTYTQMASDGLSVVVGGSTQSSFGSNTASLGVASATASLYLCSNKFSMIGKSTVMVSSAGNELEIAPTANSGNRMVTLATRQNAWNYSSAAKVTAGYMDDGSGTFAGLWCSGNAVTVSDNSDTKIWMRASSNSSNSPVAFLFEWGSTEMIKFSYVSSSSINYHLQFPHSSSGGNSGQPAYITSAGWLNSTASTRNIKRDIVYEFTESTDPHQIYKLRVAQFKYKDGYLEPGDYKTGRDVIGFIAEEVEEDFPLAAYHTNDGTPMDWQERIMIPALVYLVQEQHDEIESLKQTVRELKEAS